MKTPNPRLSYVCAMNACMPVKRTIRDINYKTQLIMLGYRTFSLK
jgi:hypothetical protein